MAFTFNVYRREKDDSNPPVAIATGLTSKNFTDDTVAVNKEYLYSIGATDGTTEKVSSEVEVSTITGYFNTFENGDNLLFFNAVSYTADYSGDGILINTATTGNVIIQLADSPNYYNFEAEFYVTYVVTGNANTSISLAFRSDVWSNNYTQLNYVAGITRTRVYSYRRGSAFVNGAYHNVAINQNVKHKVKITAVDGVIKLFVDDVEKTSSTLSLDAYRGQFGFRIYSDAASSIRIEDLKIIEL